MRIALQKPLRPWADRALRAGTRDDEASRMLHDALFHGFCFLDSSAKVCATRKGLEDTAGIVFMNLHTQAGLQARHFASLHQEDQHIPFFHLFIALLHDWLNMS